MTRLSSSRADASYYSWFDFKTPVHNVELFRTIKSIIYAQYPTPRIYDFGCGVGYITNYLGAAIGFDINSYALTTLAHRFVRLRHLKRDVTTVTLADVNHKKADAIVCLNVIEHIPDSARHRLMTNVIPLLLKKNGMVVFSLYRNFYLPNQLNMILKRGSPFDPTHVHNWTIDEFVDEIRRYFHVTHVRNYASYTKLTGLTRFLKTETLVTAKPNVVL